LQDHNNYQVARQLVKAAVVKPGGYNEG